MRTANAHPSMLEAARPVEVSLGWLRDEMDNLREIRKLADDAYERHDHGVVYALQMAPDDIEGLRWNNFMGIEAAMPIPASKIVSKIVVPSDYEKNLFWDNGEEYMRRATAEAGLIAAIAARAR